VNRQWLHFIFPALNDAMLLTSLRRVDQKVQIGDWPNIGDPMQFAMQSSYTEAVHSIEEVYLCWKIVDEVLCMSVHQLHRLQRL